MALDDILKVLEKDYEQQLAELQRQSDAQLHALQQEYAGILAREKEKILQAISQVVQRQLDLELFAVKSKLRNELLAAKRELINAVYQQALQRLAALPVADYQRLLAELLQSLPARTGLIIPTAGREDVTRQVLAASSAQYQLADHSIKSAGGFKWIGEQADIDLTFEKLVANLRTETEIEVGEKLFG